MPNENDEALAKALMKDKDIFNKMTGRLLDSFNKSDYYEARKDSRRILKIENRLYKLFLRLIDQETAKRLQELDTITEHLISKFEERTGWSVTEDMVYKETDFRSIENFEYASWDTYRIHRNKDMGFYVSASIATDQYDRNIRQVEQNFYDSNKEVLNKIHEFFSEKERIMGGNYTLKHPTPENENLARMIAIYLKYEPSQDLTIKEDNIKSL